VKFRPSMAYEIRSHVAVSLFETKWVRARHASMDSREASQAHDGHEVHRRF
jgi:hypothetical protein